MDHTQNPKDRGPEISHITVTDFLLRGRPTHIRFGAGTGNSMVSGSISKRDNKLVFPGTQLEHEFAAWLKENGRDGSRIADRH